MTRRSSKPSSRGIITSVTTRSGPTSAHGVQSRFSIGGDADPVAALSEQSRNVRAQVRVVVGEQNVPGDRSPPLPRAMSGNGLLRRPSEFSRSSPVASPGSQRSASST